MKVFRYENRESDGVLIKYPTLSDLELGTNEMSLHRMLKHNVEEQKKNPIQFNFPYHSEHLEWGLDDNDAKRDVKFTYHLSFAKLSLYHVIIPTEILHLYPAFYLFFNDFQS